MFWHKGVGISSGKFQGHLSGLTGNGANLASGNFLLMLTWQSMQIQVSHAVNPPSCGKEGGGHKNVCVSKTLRYVSQRKLARKQHIGISTRKLAL